MTCFLACFFCMFVGFRFFVCLLCLFVYVYLTNNMLTLCVTVAVVANQESVLREPPAIVGSQGIDQLVACLIEKLTFLCF